MNLGEYVVRRLVLLIVTLLGVSIVTFAITNVLPGDVAVLILGTSASQAKIEALQIQLGLDRPLWIQYVDWIAGVAVGEWGTSLRWGDPVTKLIVERLPASAFLTVVALGFAVLMAIPLGIVSALKRDRWQDAFATITAFSGMSLPDFFWGLLLILLFSKYLGALPPSGYVSPADDPIASIRHVLLPALALSFGLMAQLTRMTRSSLLQQLRAGYVQLARMKGLTERRIVYRHALPNAVLPVLTVVGLQLGFLFGGVVVIEELFAYPGLGRLMFSAMVNRDVPLIQGSVLVFAAIFMITNLVVDVLYAVVDPRLSGGGE